MLCWDSYLIPAYALTEQMFVKQSLRVGIPKPELGNEKKDGNPTCAAYEYR